MTNLPRFTISLPRDIEKKVNEMKNTPEFAKTPKSKIIAFLIRQGMGDGNKEATDPADNGGTNQETEESK